MGRETDGELQPGEPSLLAEAETEWRVFTHSGSVDCNGLVGIATATGLDLVTICSS